MLRLRVSLLIFAALPFALSAGVAVAGPAKHAPKKEAREQVLELEQQWRMATMSGDAAQMDKLLSDDYVGISWTGQVNTKAAQLDRLRMKTLMITKMDLTEIKIRVVQTVAIVTSRAQIEGTNDGADMKGEFLYTRIYQRQPSGTWRITNFEATRVPNPGGPRGRNRAQASPPPAPAQ